MLAARRTLLTALSLCAIVTARAALAGDCAPFERSFKAAAATKQIDSVRQARDAWLKDYVCGEDEGEINAKYFRALIDIAAADPAQRQGALAEVTKSLGVKEDWRTAESLGDYYWTQRDRKDAFYWYEQSLNFLKQHPDQHLGAKAFQALVAKAGAAKSDERGGTQVAQGDFYKTRAAMDGKLGGIYTNFREVEAYSVPLPVRFYYDKAEFTPEGEAAVQELAKAAIEQELASIKLVGHTDPKGSDEYNMDLSRRRVEAVRAALQKLGVRARIEIVWKGKRQPIDASVLPPPPPQDEELWALERRVEWVREGGQ